MNLDPITLPKGYDFGDARRATCDRNRERAFWQSRMTSAGKRADAPELADIHALARAVRARPSTEGVTTV